MDGDHTIKIKEYYLYIIDSLNSLDLPIDRRRSKCKVPSINTINEFTKVTKVGNYGFVSCSDDKNDFDVDSIDGRIIILDKLGLLFNEEQLKYESARLIEIIGETYKAEEAENDGEPIKESTPIKA